MTGGKLSLKADGDKIEFARIIKTKMFCGEKSLDARILQGLESARTFSIEGNTLTLMLDDASGGEMRFFKVIRQNQTK